MNPNDTTDLAVPDPLARETELPEWTSPVMIQLEVHSNTLSTDGGSSEASETHS